MRKRLVLALVLAAVLAPLVFAGGTKESAASTKGPVTIQFWYGMTGPDGAFIRKIVDAFTSANPKVTVNGTAYAWASLWTKLDASYAAGTPPAVVTMHVQDVPSYNSKGMLVPVGDALAAAGVTIDKDAYLPGALESGQVGGKQISLPLDQHACAMYYNADMFKAAGLDPNVPPKTYDDLVAYAKKLTKSDGSQYGVGLDQTQDSQFYLFVGLFYQWGGKFLSDDLKTATFDSDAARKALAQLHDLIWKYKVAPLNEEDFARDFMSQKVAIIFTGPWQNAAFPSVAGLNYATAAVPLFGTQLATWKSSHQMAVIKQSDKAQVEAGVRLAQFASANSVIWDESGMSPVLKAAADDPRLADLKFHSKGFMDSVPIARFMPLIPQGWEELFEASPDGPSCRPSSRTCARIIRTLIRS